MGTFVEVADLAVGSNYLYLYAYKEGNINVEGLTVENRTI